ncbi:MAG: recombinase family protein [Planctomycetes bacterium]|nr:recombinase family protein [Planctomycetota bacterium]
MKINPSKTGQNGRSMNGMAKLIPAASYIRMSKDKQEKSPEQQREEIAKLAKQEGCKLIREYSDMGISGDKTDKRVGFLQMIADVEGGCDFEAILCWDQDRFGRFDSLDAGHWIKPLRDRGVRLLTVAQGWIDWNDFAERIAYVIQQEGKHTLLVDMGRNSLRGRLHRIKQGYGVAKPSYGYDRGFYDAAGKLVHRVPYGQRFAKPHDWNSALVVGCNADHVATVKRIFDTFAYSDTSIESIALSLNEDGIASPEGKRWQAPVIARMLRKTVYIGQTVFGKKKSEDQRGKYYHVGSDGEITKTVRGKMDQSVDGAIVVDATHPPLIDAETFAAVQAKFKANAIGPRRANSEAYFLSGLLTCGNCDTPMYGTEYAENPNWSYYKNSRRELGGSKGVSYAVNRHAMEAFVIKHVEGDH